MTPSGVDQDYNFLTGLERKLDKADREVEGRGIVLRPESNGGNKKQRSDFAKGEVQMQKALQSRGVIIDRAPRGMTRSKQNSTNWNRKSCHRLGRLSQFADFA